MQPEFGGENRKSVQVIGLGGEKASSTRVREEKNVKGVEARLGGTDGTGR